MCGIFCMISSKDSSEELKRIYCKCQAALKHRGPDVMGSYEILMDNDLASLFCGSVLWTQGIEMCKQPVRDLAGNLLLWNGDVFDGLYMDDKCDTEVLLSSFRSTGVVETLSKINGPYSFIYYNQNSDSLWFGRDPLGRVSLLWSISQYSLTLTSVADPSLHVQELPPLGLFVLHLEKFDLSVKPWYHQSEINYTLPVNINIDEPVVYKMLQHLSDNSHCHQDGKDAIFLKEIFDGSGDMSLLYNALIGDESRFISQVSTLLDHLEQAVRIRCKTCPSLCQICKENLLPNCSHPKIGVLFSGGLDSTIIALLANKHVPPNESIDLYNVAFEKPSQNGPYNAPDRLTGLHSLAELQTLAPNRTWNFVQIDITRQELDSLREKRICKLIYPLDSVLDDSLGCALWFAASGKGSVNGLPYTSPTTVVLLGMGADEMFGGYRKARRAWTDRGWSGLTNELTSGLLNLPIRNLGRDNRVVCDHGRVPRFPFLDESVVSFAYSLPPWDKCYLGKELPEGIGDKLILRLLAWKLGLKGASVLPKRALQFGSRVANSKETGHCVSLKLKQSWDLHPP